MSAQRVTFDRHVFVLRISSFLPRDDGYNEYKLNLFPTIVRSLIRPEYSFVYPWQNIFSNYAMFATRLWEKHAVHKSTIQLPRQHVCICTAALSWVLIWLLENMVKLLFHKSPTTIHSLLPWCAHKLNWAYYGFKKILCMQWQNWSSSASEGVKSWEQAKEV